MQAPPPQFLDFSVFEETTIYLYEYFPLQRKAYHSFPWANCFLILPFYSSNCLLYLPETMSTTLHFHFGRRSREASTNDQVPYAGKWAWSHTILHINYNPSGKLAQDPGNKIFTRLLTFDTFPLFSPVLIYGDLN